MTRHFLMEASRLWDGEMVRATVAYRGQRQREIFVGCPAPPPIAAAGAADTGLAILVVRLGGVIRGFEDRCPHKGVSLSAGTLTEGVITCAAHNWAFDGRTGRSINSGATCLRQVPLIVQGDCIYVECGTGDVPETSV